MAQPTLTPTRKLPGLARSGSLPLVAEVPGVTSPSNAARRRQQSVGSPSLRGDRDQPSFLRSASTGSVGFSQRRPTSPPQDAGTSRQLYQTPFVEAYKQVAKQQNLRRLEELFEEADEDGNREMSQKEFRSALRKPWIQRTFSTLGVQPHQADLVFKTMAQNEEQELSFQQFLTGLQSVVGTDVDGTGTEVDIDSLRPTRAARLKREGMQGNAVAEGLDSRRSAMTLHRNRAPSVPEAQIHRAFVDHAQAKALLPPQSAKQPVKRPASRGRR